VRHLRRCRGRSVNLTETTSTYITTIDSRQLKDHDAYLQMLKGLFSIAGSPAFYNPVWWAVVTSTVKGQDGPAWSPFK
jgi:hypothetical protein